MGFEIESIINSYSYSSDALLRFYLGAIDCYTFVVLVVLFGGRGGGEVH